jgi:hypothetical protein
MLVSIQDLQLSQVITAIGGLGTAAFGLLDAIKPVFPFINGIGYGRIEAAAKPLLPPDPVAAAGQPQNLLTQAKILDTLRANWINGMELGAQKDAAQSLIRLHLTAGNAATVAAECGVDGAQLAGIATSLAAGTDLTEQQQGVSARFDQVVTALLSEAYQASDHDYRNWTRFFAALLAIALAVTGGWTLAGDKPYWTSIDVWLAFLVGLLATPLAPIAKNITNALATAVNTLQTAKKGA